MVIIKKDKKRLMKEWPNAIPAGEFKTKCLALMDEVNRRHHGIIITKFGKPVAKLEPICTTSQLFGCAKGSVVAKDNLFSTEETWNAEEQ